MASPHDTVIIAKSGIRPYVIRKYSTVSIPIDIKKITAGENLRWPSLGGLCLLKKWRISLPCLL